jgi:hypothetical protein
LDVKSYGTRRRCSLLNFWIRYSAPVFGADEEETYEWLPYEKFKDRHDKGDQYITFNTSPDQTPNIDDAFLLPGDPSHLPYIPQLDPTTSPLWSAKMPSVYPRDLILSSEAFWADLLYVREDGGLKKYVRSKGVDDEDVREEVREMVAVLGDLIFDMIIWITT